MLAVYAIVNGNQAGWTSTQTLGSARRRAALLGAVFLAIESRVPAPLMPLRLFALAQSRRRQRRRRALGGGAVRLVLPLRAVSATRARLQAVRGRARLPPGESDHGRASRSASRRRSCMRFGLKRPLGGGPAPRRRRARAVRPRAGRRRASASTCCRHDPARRRRRHRLQPGAARGDERRRRRANRASPRASSTPRS